MTEDVNKNKPPFSSDQRGLPDLSMSEDLSMGRQRSTEGHTEARDKSPVTRDYASGEKKSGARLKRVDAEAKSGRYIFTFGKTGSGKTTFHFHLLRYLMREGEFKTTVLPINGDRSGVNVINRWSVHWDRGTFPPGTEIGAPDEFHIEVVPEEGHRTPVDFFFLEISGEDLTNRDEVRSSGHTDVIVKPVINPVFGAYLENERIRMQIFMICDGEDPVQDNVLIKEFLDLLRFDFGDKLLRRVPISLVITKSDLAVKRLKQRDPQAQVGSRLNVSSFTEHFLPDAKTTILNWPAGHSVYAMTVGELDEDAEEPTLLEANFDDVSVIFDEIYKYFTGKELGYTSIQKIVNMIRNIF